MHGDIAHEIHEVEVSEPVRIVHDNSTVFSIEANQPLHLFFDAGNIVVKLFNAEQFAQLRLSGRIGNHCRASAEKHDGMMPAFLHMRHDAHCNIVTDGETFRRGIKADVKRQLFFAEKFAKLLRVRALFKEAALVQNVVCIAPGACNPVCFFGAFVLCILCILCIF